MNFVIERTSTDGKPCEKSVLKNGTINEFHIEINSISELMDFIKDINESIIISANGIIEIYDDYRE